MQLAFSFIMFLLTLCLLQFWEFSSLGYSYIFCGTFIYILYSIWCAVGKKITPGILFFAAFSFLFIGGRFWGVLLNSKMSLWAGYNFCSSGILPTERTRLLSYVLAFVYSFYWGYGNKYLQKNPYKCICCDSIIENQVKGKNVDWLLRLVWIVQAPMSIYNSVMGYLRVSSLGYLSLYAGAQNSEYEGGSSLVRTWTYCIFGMAMVYGKPMTKKMYVGLILVTSVFGILAGGRGGFGATLLFCLWLYSRSHKLNIRKVLLWGICSLWALLYIFSFSVRNVESGSEYGGPLEMVSSFFYDQGISLAVFNSSMNLTYPIVPYLQSFIPGSAYLYHLFTGEILQSYDIGFGNYLSHALNPALYAHGYGLGWTLLGSLYLFSGKIFIVFIALSFISGKLLAWFEIKAEYNTTYQMLLFTIFMNLMMLPRAGLEYIFPLMIYALIIKYVILKITSR